ncbi:MAG: hypothetical protein FJ275_13410, partial [Planctomycetes bacterium]|nr:hypothetical protein [Planctomycetota bacterium]
MITPRRLVASLLPLAVAASAARAAPLDLDRVSAKAVWVMHADMDAARESTVVKRMVERAVKKHAQLETMLAMAAKMMGMDPRKDLHDVTLFGLDTEKKNAVMIVRADANRAFLEKMVEKARDHETMKHRDYTLHQWKRQGKKGRGGDTVVGSFHRDDVMVFARSADRVQMALDVLDGKADSADGEGPLAGRTRPGSILVARAAKVDPDTKCPVLRQGEGYRVAMGESEGRSFYRARLEMESAEAATLAESVADGFAATAVLGLGKDKGVMKLIEGLETMTEGRTCMITWEADADDVWVVAEA